LPHPAVWPAARIDPFGRFLVTPWSTDPASILVAFGLILIPGRLLLGLGAAGTPAGTLPGLCLPARLLLLPVIGTLGDRRRGFTTLLPRHFALGFGQLLASWARLMLGRLLLFRLLLPGLGLGRLLTGL
jgi:hypothetical protein